MNKSRRKDIDAVLKDMSDLRLKLADAFDALDDAIRPAIDAIVVLHDEINILAGRVEDIKSEEEEYLSNMPESMQDGDKGGAAQEAIDALDTAYTAIDGAASYLDEVLQPFLSDGIDLSDIDNGFEEAEGELNTAKGE